MSDRFEMNELLEIISKTQIELKKRIYLMADMFNTYICKQNNFIFGSIINFAALIRHDYFGIEIIQFFFLSP